MRFRLQMNTKTKKLSCLVIAMLYLNAANATIAHFLPSTVHIADRAGELMNANDDSQEPDIQLSRRHAAGFTSIALLPELSRVFLDPSIFSKISFYINAFPLLHQSVYDCAVGDLPPPLNSPQASV